MKETALAGAYAPVPPCVKLVFTGDPLKTLNPNRDPRRSWTNQEHTSRWMAAELEIWRTKLLLAWIEGGQPRFQEKVSLRFHVKRGRTIDPGNALAGLQKIIDVLTTRNASTPRKGTLRGGCMIRVERMIPDDTACWIEFAPVTFETGKHWKENPEVHLYVTPIGAYASSPP